LDLGIVDRMGWLDHLADFAPFGCLDDYAISPGKLESCGIEVVDLDPIVKNDPYNIGH
jgi:hypothetical protein